MSTRLENAYGASLILQTFVEVERPLGDAFIQKAFQPGILTLLEEDLSMQLRRLSVQEEKSCKILRFCS